jgi:hypothetical protein
LFIKKRHKEKLKHNILTRASQSGVEWSGRGCSGPTSLLLVKKRRRRNSRRKNRLRKPRGSDKRSFRHSNKLKTKRTKLKMYLL